MVALEVNLCRCLQPNLLELTKYIVFKITRDPFANKWRRSFKRAKIAVKALNLKLLGGHSVRISSRAFRRTLVELQRRFCKKLISLSVKCVV